MKRFLSFLVVMVLTASAALAAGFTDDMDAIEAAAKSVLMIDAYDENNRQTYVSGSGFVLFSPSILVTNYHVIADATEVYATTDDDRVFEVKYVLCADKQYDIAILEFAEATDIKPFEAWPDNQLKRGSHVIAIGSPAGGNKNTVSSGIVSSQNDREDGRPEIQFTASVSHGNSGGPLIDDEGRVIGVVTETYNEGQNINFAVNIAVAQAMYNAWDGEKYTFKDHKSKADMDFTGVYEHTASAPAVQAGKTDAAGSWTCPECGRENTTKFCQSCGAQRPYWACSCGRENSNRFCGECGRSCSDQIALFNSAMEKANAKDYAGAIEILSDLGTFYSGSFETVEGPQVRAAEYVGRMYYEQAAFLRENGGSYEEIVRAYTNAGDYSDAKEQIKAVTYELAETALGNGERDRAYELFAGLGEFRNAEERAAGIQAEIDAEKAEIAGLLEDNPIEETFGNLIGGNNEEKKTAADTQEPPEGKKAAGLMEYSGEEVSLQNLQLVSWAIESPSGSFYKKSDIFLGKAQDKDGYRVILLCKFGQNHVEILLDNYKGFGWEDDENDLLGCIYKLTTVSVTGTVQAETAEWSGIDEQIPKVLVESIGSIHWQ